jgi:hypothetical protein
MSSTTQPISPAQFRPAITDLPLENLFAKASEITNSITHLERSNAQLQTYSDSIRSDTTIDGGLREEVGDRECLEAIRENEVVIGRSRERLGLLREEVQRRGARWPGEMGDGSGADGPEAGAVNGGNEREGRAGGLSDEELRRRMEDRMGGDGGDADGTDGGMHL